MKRKEGGHVPVMCHSAAVCVRACVCVGHAKSSGMPLTLAVGDTAAAAAVLERRLSLPVSVWGLFVFLRKV